MVERNKKNLLDGLQELPHNHPFYTDGVIYVRGFSAQELKPLKSKDIRKILGSGKPIKVNLDLINPLNLIDGSKLIS